MTDRITPDADEPLSDVDQAADDESPPAPDSDRSEHLPATRPARMGPSALDLERASD